VLVDRWHLPRALGAGNLVAAGSVAALLLVDGPGRVWVIYVAAFAENLAGTVLNPAGSALTRVIVGAGPELGVANALNSMSGSVLRLVAPPLGALILAVQGFGAVVLIDSASYVVAAAVVAVVGRRVSVRRQPAPDGRKLLADLVAGVAQVARTPLLRGPLIGFALFLFANAGLTALLVPLVEGPLASPGYAVGYLITGLGVGYIAGSALAVPLLARLRTRQVLAGTQLAIAGGFFLLVDAPNLATAVMAAALMGIPGSILLIAVGTHVQQLAPPEMQGRVGALSGATASLANILGALCAPMLVAMTSLGVATNAMSTFALLAVAGTWLVVPPEPALELRS
jgi:predicted MFS family arabinose efflux permease